MGAQPDPDLLSAWWLLVRDPGLPVSPGAVEKLKTLINAALPKFYPRPVLHEAVVEGDGPEVDLLPVARDGLRLLLGQQGSSLRQRLLLSLVANDRLHTDDLQALLALVRRTFSPRRLAGGLLARLNPLAA